MTLMDELAAEAMERPGPMCGVRSQLEALPEAERSWLQKALDSDYPATFLARSGAFARRGIDVKYQSIQRHRRGDCQCRPTTI